MISNWETVRLGDVFQPCSTRLGAHEDEPPVFAISKYDGVVLSADYHDRRVASANLDTYKIVGVNDWAYSTIHIDEGSIARNRHGYQGVVSPMYTIMRWISVDHDPSYFELLLKSPQMLAAYGAFAQGSINRRKSLPWKTFSDLQISAPSLDEQRRIVDLVGSLDDAIEAADKTVFESKKMWSSTILAELSNADAEPVKAESLFGHVIGGAWGSPAGQEDTAVLAIGPSSYAGSRLEVDESMATERSLSSKKAAVRSLRKGDIVLERSGGSPTQPVGRVLRMTSAAANVVPSDFMRLLRPAPEVVNVDLAFWIMWALYQADASLPYQKFTTGIRNLNIPDYLASVFVKIPTTPEEQLRIVHLAESFAAVTANAASHAASLRRLRSELLTSLLSGTHTIPESYDDVMPVAEELVTA